MLGSVEEAAVNNIDAIDRLLLTLDYTSLRLYSLIQLTLSATGSGLRLVLDSGFSSMI